MPFIPHASPAVLADRNSNSAFEKLKFIEEHYEQLMAAYQDIMAHLKLVGNGSGGSSSEPVELPDNIVFYDPNSLSDAYPSSVPYWNQITGKPYEALHTGASLLIDEEPYHLPKGILYLTTVNSNYNTYHLVSADGDVLFNVDELITSKMVGNEASKIPVYTEDGHLRLPDGTELWCEDAE